MPKFTETDGRRLAVDMLNELAEVGADRACIDAGIRVQMGYGAQANVVARYLGVLRERASAELEAGFGSVLSDLVASAVEGGELLDFYEQRVDVKVAALCRERA